ncbi:hypothetical protein [Marinobacter sp. M5B]|uniref:hypothetical protein n=1 Tax=Marinobacter sp. M5B TaxID=3141535 RepID=UPI0036D2A020
MKALIMNQHIPELTEQFDKPLVIWVTATRSSKSGLYWKPESASTVISAPGTHKNTRTSKTWIPLIS